MKDASSLSWHFLMLAVHAAEDQFPQFAAVMQFPEIRQSRFWRDWLVTYSMGEEL